MTRDMLIALELLAAHSPSSGLDLVKLSDGRLRRGTVYVHLSALIDEGFVRMHEDPDSIRIEPVSAYEYGVYYTPKRYVYRITSAGRQAMVPVL